MTVRYEKQNTVKQVESQTSVLKHTLKVIESIPPSSVLACHRMARILGEIETTLDHHIHYQNWMWITCRDHLGYSEPLLITTGQNSLSVWRNSFTPSLNYQHSFSPQAQREQDTCSDKTNLHILKSDMRKSEEYNKYF